MTTLEHLLTGGPRLTVGMITADLSQLARELETIKNAGIELVHIDVMDGVFCPTLTVGPPITKAIKTAMIKDVHLMIDDPLPKVDAFITAGADMITFNVESSPQPHRVLQVLRRATNVNDPERGLICGVAINPSTPVDVIEPLIDDLDYVLVLAVNPGWGAQSFIPSTERRVRRVREIVAACGRQILVGIDGGVTRENASRVLAMDVDLVAAGSVIFDGKAVVNNVQFMLARTSEAQTLRRGGGLVRPRSEV